MNAITSPKHYTSLPAACSGCAKPIECIDVIKHMNFNRGNAVKYIWRAGLKGDDIEDLQKAIQCLEFEISRVGGKAPAKKPAPVEPHDPSLRVDTSRINFALNNPGLPVPDTVKDGPVEAVEPDDDPEPVEELWRPVEGKYGRTRDGQRVLVLKTVSSSFVPFAGRFEDGRCEHYSDDGTCIDFSASGYASDLISEWVEPEATLTMREGAWYKRRDGQVCGPARKSQRFPKYPWWVCGISYANDGSNVVGRKSKADLIREVPAPDAPLDAQAIYDNNPADLLGSVWGDAQGGEWTMGSGSDYIVNLKNERGSTLAMESMKGAIWRVLDSGGFTLLRLASKEAAE